MWVLIILFIFILATTMAKTAASEHVAKNVVKKWQTLAERFSAVYGIPRERILAHIAVESLGQPYAVRNDSLDESFIALSENEAFKKLTAWENQGYSALSASIGLMQVVPKYALVDFNRTYFRAIPAYALLQPETNVEVGTGFLQILLRRHGTLDKASRAYNGSLNNPKTEKYLQKILAYEAIIKQQLTTKE